MFTEFEIRGHEIRECKACYMPKLSSDGKYLAGKLTVKELGIDFWYTHQDDPRKTFPSREEAIKNLNIFRFRG